MATIYLHETGNGLGDNTLVLEPREAVVYPFDFGNDWKELRLGMFFSYCGLSGNNSSWGYEVLPNPQSSTMLNDFYFGFTNANAPFPNDSNNYYYGACMRAGYGPSFTLGYGLNSMATLSAKKFVSGQYVSVNTQQQSPNIPTYESINLPTGYAGYLGFACSSSFDSGSTQSSLITGVVGAYGTRDFTAYNINNLESLINAIIQDNNSATQWTTDGTTGGALLPRPNAILVYSPFINNKLRIHSILLTKTA